ncbi:MAG TPA: MXAN_6577-like cysteine-rich protein [Vulgatibacter sp.]|nr:MXAN_6577-like cysteine-rich protein [Vulgatibacter sp.]
MRVVVASLLSLLALSFAACSSSDDPPGDPTCPAGLTLCDGACVDLTSDKNCGACGVECTGETTCRSGSCVLLCEDGETDCGTFCARTDDDPKNCGACGNACDEGEECAAGRCAVSCGDGMLRCDGQCVDGNHPDHCGSCENQCDEGQVCNQGECQAGCDDGLEECSGACVDLGSDAAHCGACGNACDAGMVCADSDCACPAGTELCDGACVDTSTDAAHCGGCGIACEDGVSCEDGACGCPPGQERCDGVCVDTSTDAAHCGGCGNACSGGDHAEPACEAGECVLACLDDRADCDEDSSNGCETDAATDPANCGTCGITCGPDESCTDGVCCGPEGGVCGGVCVDLQGDAQNCGACGVSCVGQPGSTGGVCTGGACELACEALWGDCNADPTDGCELNLTSDPGNCGACGNTCGAVCGGGDCLAMTFPAKMFHTSCVLSDDGRVLCWGQNGCGQVGNGQPPAANCHVGAGSTGVARPTEVAGIGGAVHLAVGEHHNCAILSDGGVRCWGLNHKGQLGGGDTSVYTEPVEVMDGDELLEATALALTDSSTCALVGGNVKCWGSFANGRLGNDADADQLAPAFVMDGAQPLSGVVGLAAGMNHVCALLQSGQVTCWGGNLNGQLGRGTSGSSTDSPVPTVIAGLAGVDEVYAAGFRTCVRIGGTGKCWGQNLSGQNGTGDTTQNTEPLDIVGLTDARSLTVAANHTCAVRTNGQAQCWGLNSFGQLGNGATSTSPQPTAVPVVDPASGQPMTGIRSMTAGGAHSCLVMDDDSVFCLGYDAVGQLGTGAIPSNPNQPNTVPVPVAW